MSETHNLTALRSKLVARRRQLVETQASAPADHVIPESIWKIQEAIEAVGRALADENDQEFRRRKL